MGFFSQIYRLKSANRLVLLKIAPLWGRNARARGCKPLQAMDHLAIYLDLNFDPQGVALHYSDPNSFVQRGKGLKKGVALYLDVRFWPGGGGLLFDPWSSQDPGHFLGGGVNVVLCRNIACLSPINLPQLRLLRLRDYFVVL